MAIFLQTQSWWGIAAKRCNGSQLTFVVNFIYRTPNSIYGKKKIDPQPISIHQWLSCNLFYNLGIERRNLS